MKTRRRLTVGAGAGLALVVAGAIAVRAQESAAPAPPVRPVPVELVALTPAESAAVLVSGQLDAWRRASVSAEVTARVQVAPPRVGERIAAGQTLARLDEDLVRTEVAAAEADLARARAARGQLDAEYRRAQIETALAIDAARAQVAQSDAGVAQARAGSLQAAELARKTRTATRAQELAQAEAALRRARVEEDLAHTEQGRYTYLFHEGVVAAQAHDRVMAAAASARAGREAAQESVSLAREGARQEDIAASAAALSQADAAVRAGLARRQEATVALRRSQTRDLQLDSLRRQREQLAAQESRALAARDEARLRRGRHRIVAPFAGSILERRVEVGELVAAGAPVATLGETTRLKALFAVPESARGGLAVGRAVTITVDALPGRRIPAAVHAVGVRADRTSRTFPLELRLENATGALLPGMAARLTLSTPAAPLPALPLPALPLSAVAVDTAGPYVLTVEEGRARRRPVTLGAVRGERVAVTGLASAARVIATPQRVLDGAVVEVLR